MQTSSRKISGNNDYRTSAAVSPNAIKNGISPQDDEETISGSRVKSLSTQPNRINKAITNRTRFKMTTENEQIESIKLVADLLIRKIEALENALPEISLNPFNKCGNLDEIIRLIEINLIKNALKEAQWSQTKAAQMLGIKPTTLNAKIKRFQISCK